MINLSILSLFSANYLEFHRITITIPGILMLFTLKYFHIYSLISPNGLMWEGKKVDVIMPFDYRDV